MTNNNELHTKIYKEFKQKYSFKEIEKIDNGKGYWNYIKIGIYDGDNLIGDYIRNYSNMYETFHPFLQLKENGTIKEYILCSKHYTATNIISLPDCKSVAGENPTSFGFCPVDFYVPWNPKIGWKGQHGFVAGCVWGDDSSWKIQYLDLSKIDQGILVRDDRFGYIELQNQQNLKDAIDLLSIEIDKNEKNDKIESVCITSTKRFYINGYKND